MFVETNFDIRERYSSDWNNDIIEIAECVVFPESEQEVAQAVEYAIDNTLNIVVRGGNTGLVGGVLVPGRRAAVIAMERVTDELAYNRQSETVSVSAGVTLLQVNQFLEKFGRQLPLHMGSYQSAQIGGILATNAGGMHAWKYGMARNLVKSVRYITANNVPLREQTTNLKNNIGLNVADVLLGSEGRLGIIAGAELRTVLAAQQSEGVLLLAPTFSDFIHDFDLISQVLIEYVETCEFVGGDLPIVDFEKNKGLSNHHQLLINFACGGNRDNLRDTIEVGLATILDQLSSEIIILSSQQFFRAQKNREELPLKHRTQSELYKFDLQIPRETLDEFHSMVDEAANQRQIDVRFSFFGHFLDGNLHLNVSRDCVDEDAFGDKVTAFIQKCGGSMVAEHGVGMKKLQILNVFCNDTSQQLRKHIKLSMDPTGLFI